MSLVEELEADKIRANEHTKTGVEVAQSSRIGRPAGAVSKLPAPPTVEEIMTLARSLPLTKAVLRNHVEKAPAAQRRSLHELFTEELYSRAEAKKLRFIRQAGFPVMKTFNGYDWQNIHWPPDFGKGQLQGLEFIANRENLVLFGDVGTGKTHLAIALGYAACNETIPVRFWTASSLIAQLRHAQNSGRLEKELAAISKYRVLIIDELGYLPIDNQGARLLFQVIANAYETQTVIYTSNLEFSRWGQVFGDEQMAAAIIDRTVHHGRMVRFKGGSYRVANATMK